MVFFERIKQLLKIVVPSYKTKEMAYLITLTGLLVVRTYLSIWLADVNGQIVRSIVNRSLSDFLKRVYLFYPDDIFIDICSDAVFYPLFRSKFRNGIFLKVACNGIQRATYRIFPWQVFAKNVLLQSKITF